MEMGKWTIFIMDISKAWRIYRSLTRSTGVLPVHFIFFLILEEFQIRGFCLHTRGKKIFQRKKRQSGSQFSRSDFQKHVDASCLLHRRTVASASPKRHKPGPPLVYPSVVWGQNWRVSEATATLPMGESRLPCCNCYRGEMKRVSTPLIIFIFLFIYYMPGITQSIMNPMVTQYRWAVFLWKHLENHPSYWIQVSTANSRTYRHQTHSRFCWASTEDAHTCHSGPVEAAHWQLVGVPPLFPGCEA